MTLEKRLKLYLVGKANSNSWDSKHFYPSTLSLPCLRKIFYQYTNTPADYPKDENYEKVTSLGKLIHWMIQGWLKDCGLSIPYITKEGKPEKEFPIKSDNLDLAGRVDAVTVWKNKLYVIEIKTVSNWVYNNLYKKPTEEHAEQGAAYLWAFNKGLKEGMYSHIPEVKPYDKLAGIIFMYYNRDSGKYKFIHADEKFLKPSAKAISHKAKEVQKAVQTRTLPGKTEHYCKTCPFRDKCAREYNPLLESTDGDKSKK